MDTLALAPGNPLPRTRAPRPSSPRVGHPAGWESTLLWLLAALLGLVLAAAAAAADTALAGRWNWGAGGGVTELNADGSGRDARGNTVQWAVRDAAARSYTLRWSHGYTDTVTLAPDGNSLSGRNQTGFQFSATRMAAAPARPAPPIARAVDPAAAAAIAGEWEWSMGGGRVQIWADGGGKDGRNNTVKWVLRDAATRTYGLTWSHGYSDTAVLSADGRELRVTPSHGGGFTARRVGAVATPAAPPPVPSPPLKPLDLNGSWGGGALHIWQNGADVLATATWKRDDGKYVAWRGEGQLQGRTLELRIRYSPMTHGPVADWRGAFTVSADGNTIDADYAYTASPLRDHRVYARDR